MSCRLLTLLAEADVGDLVGHEIQDTAAANVLP